MTQKIAIPDEETVPLDAISAGVVGLRVLFVNVFAVAGESGWTLIDAGLNGSARRIRRWAEGHFGSEPPNAIVLTHAHFDHVGTLDELLETWPDVMVYAHRAELPYLTGQRDYAPPDPSVGGGMMARMATLYPRATVDISGHVEELPDDESVPGLPGWRAVHTPGHTPGHTSFFRDIDRTLLAGDAFCTTKQESFFAVATQRPELSGPPAYFTTDWDAARESVRRLSALRPTFIAASHGQPMAGETSTRALRLLADRFDAVARPDTGTTVAGQPR